MGLDSSPSRSGGVSSPRRGLQNDDEFVWCDNESFDPGRKSGIPLDFLEADMDECVDIM
jgi:hypothetical protein